MKEATEMLMNAMKEAIAEVYGSEQVETIYGHIADIIAKTKELRPQYLQDDDISRTNDWYKDEVCYMFYADQFGASNIKGYHTFYQLIEMLPYLKDLGVSLLYILPFIDSPMSDAGFDVRDPKNVRSELGGLPAFQAFMQAAHQEGFKIKADLILNHFSDQHHWFQEALNGDLEKLGYFLVREEMPPYEKYRDPVRGIVVDYTEPDGSISSRRLIFPESCDNHYRKQEIQGKTYYFYHTFYPFQLDINWKNPKVLYEVLDIIAYWSNLGIDIFRIDAIPYFIKEPGANAENLPETHRVVKLLSAFLQAIGPRSVIQAEACQWPEDILPYFGQEKALINTMKRTDEVQIAYHFPYMPALWASMLTANNQYFWDAFDRTPPIPESAAWAVFLRVHDELTLEMVDVSVRELLYNTLLDKGAEFRKGFGVSGRMSNFLDQNPARIAQAFSILLSLPGIPIIYYGDEIGALNNWDYAKQSAQDREIEQAQKSQDLMIQSFFDSRDINRGFLLKENFYKTMEQSNCNQADASEENSFEWQIHNRVKEAIAFRKAHPALRQGKLIPVEASEPSALAYLRVYPSESILMVHNLGERPVHVTLQIPSSTTPDMLLDLDGYQSYRVKIAVEEDILLLCPPLH